MADHTQLPWKWQSRIEDLNGTGPIQTGSIYAEPTKGHAYSVAVAPKYQTEQRWKADAAFIVKACEVHDDLVEALTEARKQLEEYELAATGEKYNSLQINSALERAAK